MKGKKRIGAAVSCMVCLAVSAAVCAAQSAQAISHHTISIGRVSARVEEKYQEEQLYPASQVEKVVEVRNTGDSDVFVRVAVNRYFLEDGLNPELIVIDYNTEDWLEKEEWFYYRDVLSPNEKSSPLFESFTLSEEVDNRYAGVTGGIEVNMECIQAAAGAIATWGITKEELGISYEENAVSIGDSTVTFLDFKKGFAFAPENTDLFVNYKSLMPGETRTQTVHVKNQYQKETEIFLSAVLANQDTENEELIRKLIREYCRLTVEEPDGTVLYDGAVYGRPDEAGDEKDTMRYDHTLGVFAPGQEKDLKLTLTVSPELENTYQELTGCINWSWRAEADEDSIDTPNLGITSEGGNYSPVILWFSAACSVLFAVLLVLVLRRKEERD